MYSFCQYNPLHRSGGEICNNKLCAYLTYRVLVLQVCIGCSLLWKAIPSFVNSLELSFTKDNSVHNHCFSVLYCHILQWLKSSCPRPTNPDGNPWPYRCSLPLIWNRPCEPAGPNNVRKVDSLLFIWYVWTCCIMDLVSLFAVISETLSHQKEFCC